MSKKNISVFFDTEFSTLGDKINLPRLISIGCVASEGREFYAELTDTWQKENCSEFVIETVLPLLQGGEVCMTEAVLEERLKAWIEGFVDEVVFRSDSPSHDWPFVEKLFKLSGWPLNLRTKCGTILFESDRQAHRYNNAVEDYFKTHGKRQHHALVDARSMQYAWKYAIKRSF